MSRTIGFKEVFGKISYAEKKPHVSANSSTTAKKWIWIFLLLPNEESSLWQNNITPGVVEFALSYDT